MASVGESSREGAMKLIGRLRDEVEKAETREEKKGLIERAGMELKDEELDQVVGGERTGERLFRIKCGKWIPDPEWQAHISTCSGSC